MIKLVQQNIGTICHNCALILVRFLQFSGGTNLILLWLLYIGCYYCCTVLFNHL